MYNQHGTALKWREKGFLILGPSGSGKTTLALALLHEGGTLIADDGVLLTAQSGILKMESPPLIQGLIAIPYIGIMDVLPIKSCSLSYVIELLDTPCPSRLPQDYLWAHKDFLFPKFLLPSRSLSLNTCLLKGIF
jgi:HPr kinase/phosphorylase